MCSLLLSCASYGEGIDTAAAPIPSEWRGLDTQYASQLLSTFLACRCLLCLQGILLYGIFFGRTGCEAQCWLAVSRDSLVFSYHRDTVGRCWPVWPSAASALFHLQVVTQTWIAVQLGVDCLGGCLTSSCANGTCTFLQTLCKPAIGGTSCQTQSATVAEDDVAAAEANSAHPCRACFPWVFK